MWIRDNSGAANQSRYPAKSQCQTLAVACLYDTNSGHLAESMERGSVYSKTVVPLAILEGTNPSDSHVESSS